MGDDAKKELEEAVEAVEEIIEANQLPFGRWLIQLLVKEVLAKALIPAISGAAAAWGGYYFIGQPELEQRALEVGGKAAEVEVEKLERARKMVEEAVPPAQPVPPLTPMLQPVLPVTPETLPESLSPEEVDEKVAELRKRWDELELPEDTTTQDAINAVDVRIMEQRKRFPETYIRERLAEVKK